MTQWRGSRRIQTTTKKDEGDVRTLWLAVRTATGLANGSNISGQSLPDTRGDLDSQRKEERKVDPSPPPSDGSGRQNAMPSGVGNSGDLAGTNGVPSAPADISAEFQSEMAAIRSHYAAKIAAARRRLPARDLAVAIRAILDEETIALRAVTERWRAATERQKQEIPQRPMGNVQRKDDPKL